MTPLKTHRENILSSFGRMLLAELRLMFKGVHWWWYLVAVGFMVAGLFSPLDISRQYLLPAAWIWPILLWSPMGNRETHHHMEQLVFSTAHPLRRQLPAIWSAGFILAMVAGGGLAVRLIAAGQLDALVAWLIGGAFISSLALALGIWSGSSKLFEVVYLLLWYVGPMNRVAVLDYMGITDEALAAGVPLYYLALSVALIGFAMAGRRRRKT